MSAPLNDAIADEATEKHKDIFAGYYVDHQIEIPLPMEWESEEDF